MQTNPAVEQNKYNEWSESLWNQPGRKVKGLRRKGFAKEPRNVSLLRGTFSLTACTWPFINGLQQRKTTYTAMNKSTSRQNIPQRC